MKWIADASAQQGACVELEAVLAAECGKTEACQEMARDGVMFLLTNSRHPHASLPAFTRRELAAFIDGCKRGEFDELLEMSALDVQEQAAIELVGKAFSGTSDVEAHRQRIVARVGDIRAARTTLEHADPSTTERYINRTPEMKDLARRLESP